MNQTLPLLSLSAFLMTTSPGPAASTGTFGGENRFRLGREGGQFPIFFPKGVAFADSPTGPFTKHGAPFHAGHEVMIWPQGKGVASLATAAGPRVVYFAADGLTFAPRMEVKNQPSVPGAWRRDDFANHAVGRGLEWGSGHKNQSGALHLVRFDCLSATELAPVQPKNIGKKGNP